MRICIVGPSFGYGGANIIAAKIGKELAKENEVYYFSYEDDENFLDIPKENLFFCSKPENKNISKFGKGLEMLIRKEYTPSKYKKKEVFELLKILEQKKIETVILNSFIASTIFAKIIKKENPNIKIISWMHEDTDYCFNELAKNYRKALSEAIELSDSIVCLSQKAYKVYKKMNAHTYVIYNPMILKSEKKSNLKDKTISFTSRLAIKVKGLDYLVDVIKGLPEDWVVRIAGQGNSEEEQNFLQLLRDNNVSERVHFVGALKGEKLENHYLRSSIFLSTSRTEALPLVIIEALSYGLPVVSFDHSGAKELLDNGNCGFLISDFNTVEMVNKINSLISSYSLRKEYQEKALKKAQEFEMSKVIKEWKTVLNS